MPSAPVPLIDAVVKVNGAELVVSSRPRDVPPVVAATVSVPDEKAPPPVLLMPMARTAEEVVVPLDVMLANVMPPAGIVTPFMFTALAAAPVAVTVLPAPLTSTVPPPVAPNGIPVVDEIVRPPLRNEMVAPVFV